MKKKIIYFNEDKSSNYLLSYLHVLFWVFFVWHCFLVVLRTVPGDKWMKNNIFTFEAAAKIAENFALAPDGEYKPWIMPRDSRQRQSVLTQRQSEVCALKDNTDSGLSPTTAGKVSLPPKPESKNST